MAQYQGAHIGMLPGRAPMNTTAMVLAASAIAACSDGAWADDRLWINPAGGEVSDPANWAGGVAPGAADTAVFDLGGEYTIRFAADGAVLAIVVRDRVSLDLGGRTAQLLSEDGEAVIVGGGTREAMLRLLDGIVSIPADHYSYWHAVPSTEGTTTLEVGPGGTIYLHDNGVAIEAGARLVMRGGTITYPGYPWSADIGVSGALDLESGTIDVDGMALRGGPFLIGRGWNIYLEGGFYADDLTLDGSHVYTYDGYSVGSLHVTNGGSISGSSYEGYCDVGDGRVDHGGAVYGGVDLHGHFTVTDGGHLDSGDTYANFGGDATVSGPGSSIWVGAFTEGPVILSRGALGEFSEIDDLVEAQGVGTTVRGIGPPQAMFQPDILGELRLVDGAHGEFPTLVIDGVATLGERSELQVNADLQNWGTLTGPGHVTTPTLQSTGRVAPGAEVLRLSGGYQQWIDSDGGRRQPGTLEISIVSLGPDGSGRLEAGGAAELDGQLRVTTASGLELPAGARLTVVRAGSVTGRFATVDLPALQVGWEWRVEYEATEVVLRVVAIGCRVDLDGDGAAGIGDFLAFLQAYAAGDARADFNQDGRLNVDDLAAFLDAFAAGC
jgi:hypothetical protein